MGGEFLRKGRFFLSLGAICFIAAGGVWWQGNTDQKSEGTTDLQVVDELLTIISKESVYDTTPDLLVEGALRGMANAINDPYSKYYTEKEASLHSQTLASERIGIGLEISESNGKFIIISPVKSSPAEKAGIRPLDELVQINETRLEGKTMGDVLNLIQGKEGEKVNLVLYRPSLDRHIKVNVERRKLKNETVHAETVTIEDTKIGYMTISMFGEKTATEWHKALNSMLDEDVEGLIVDVRDNPGGYLHSVAQVLSTLGPNDKIFAYMQNNEGAIEALKTAAESEEGKEGKKDEESEEKMEKVINSLPITVLQNEGSASASEVFAGAMKDWKRGTIIGLKSFGKGTVQQTWDLQNGGELKLSTNKWLTPSQQWIHGIGIETDIEVKQHPLYSVELKLLSGRFEQQDFSEEIAYSQLVLSEFGYKMVRDDGFFDEITAEAVLAFRERHDLPEGSHMDEVFFAKLSEELKLFKERPDNDMQLQMAISYLMHQISM